MAPGFKKSDPTRDLAFKALSEILMRGNTLDAAFEHAQGDARDKAAAYRITVEVLRRAGTLKEIIGQFIKKEPPQGVEIALMIGVAQLLFLEAPAYAAINTTLELLERRKFKAFKGFANAVLRKISTTENLLDDLDCPRLDTPSWLWKAWGKNARAITDAYYTRPPLDLTTWDRKTAEQIAEKENGELLGGNNIRLGDESRITALEEFKEGKVWAQDFAASLIVKLLGNLQGKDAADICAAPGGKSMQMASLGAKLTAVEKSKSRAKRLEENFERCGIKANIKVMDAARYKPQNLHEVVLLDAPCTATGTFRRNPDVLRLKGERDIISLTETQADLLKCAEGWVKKDGVLLYSVCSLLDREGRDQIHKALESGCWKLDPIKPEEVFGLEGVITEEGYLFVLPSTLKEKGGMDGFFAARLIRL